MPQAVWISHQIWSRSVSLWLGPNMGTEHFVLASRQIRVCVIFRPMGDARTKAGAVLLKKVEPRHAVHPMGAGDGGADPPRENDGKRFDDCVPSARALFCLGLRLTASRASEASRLAHYKRSTISSREITSSRLLWVRLPWSVLWRLVLREGVVVQPREHGQVASHLLFPQLICPPELKGQ